MKISPENRILPVIASNTSFRPLPESHLSCRVGFELVGTYCEFEQAREWNESKLNEYMYLLPATMSS